MAKPRRVVVCSGRVQLSTVDVDQAHVFCPTQITWAVRTVLIVVFQGRFYCGGLKNVPFSFSLYIVAREIQPFERILFVDLRKIP